MTTDRDTYPTEGSADLWIGAVPSLDPAGREVLLGLGPDADDPGTRLVRRLLDRGHEGEEGVFHLLPEDLCARCERIPGLLAVTLLARRDVLAHVLLTAPDEERALPEALPADPQDDNRVVLLRRELATAFAPAEQDGEPRPVLLIDHDGGPSSGPGELTALFEAGEAGIAVICAEPFPDAG
ncbi:hypothetical protein ACIRQY_10280 [Streptomyces sp. NPDC101490]|uniref:hypothetical protein n=1 Tax=Streptomyces sp. NPDC101490 TaxID=3366143 RepID=UPI0038287EE3